MPLGKTWNNSYIDQLYLQVTENVIEHNDLPFQQPETITEEQGHSVPNAGVHHQKIDEQNVENPKDTKNGFEVNAEDNKKSAN